MTHSIKLDLYEGPIDLLLYLVRRGEIDICQIPVARIAKEYLEYVRLLEVIDLAAASEFIAMAVALLRFKLEMLLPSRRDESESLEPAPPQSQDEYLELKELAQQLGEAELSAAEYFSRPRPVLMREEYREGEEEASFLDLLSAFKAVMERERKVGFYRVSSVPVSVEERMEEILRILEGGERVAFFRLFEVGSKIMLVTTFLALLELIRLRKVRAVQSEPFGQILVYRVTL